jgi:thiol-disulfide isomerase/thioredoxin
MNKRIVTILAAASVLLGNLRSNAAETNSAPATPSAAVSGTEHPQVETALNLLVARIKAKLETGKEDESDYSDIIKDLDSLLAKYPKAENDRLNILASKGKLYLTLDDPAKALAIFQQVKTEFPSIQLNGNTDDFLAGLKDEASSKQIRDNLKPGSPFPDFNEKDLQGNALSISKYKGKVVLVDFWATWCGPCVAELPEIQSAYNKYHNKGFEIVGISLDDDEGALEKFVKLKKMPWPQYFEGKRFDGKLPVKYGVNATPTTYLIDRNGKIIKQVKDPAALDEEIANALKKS